MDSTATVSKWFCRAGHRTRTALPLVEDPAVPLAGKGESWGGVIPISARISNKYSLIKWFGCYIYF
jgi:hypothetical protein